MDIFAKLHSGDLYSCTDKALLSTQAKYLDKLYDYNQTRLSESDKRTALLKEMLAEMGRAVISNRLFAPTGADIFSI